MLLSDAILKGCEIRPQCYQSLIQAQFETQYPYELIGFRSCVIGAAYEGVFGKLPLTYDPITHGFESDEAYTTYDQLKTIFPILEEKFAIVIPGHPDCLSFEGEIRTHGLTLYTYLVCLNDSRRWTREQIAAWVKYVVEGQPMIPED